MVNEVKIGRYYEPKLPNLIDYDAYLIQEALIGKRRGWFARLLEWFK